MKRADQIASLFRIRSTQRYAILTVFMLCQAHYWAQRKSLDNT